MVKIQLCLPYFQHYMSKSIMLRWPKIFVTSLGSFVYLLKPFSLAIPNSCSLWLFHLWGLSMWTKAISLYSLEEGAMSTELYSDSEESGSESEELTDDDETIEDDEYDEDGTDASDVDIDEDFEHASNETHSETGDTGDDELYDDKGSNGPRLISKSNESDDDCKAHQKSSSSSPQSSSTQHVNVHITENFPNQNNNSSAMQANVSSEVLGDNHAETSLVHKLTDKSPYKSPSSHVQNSTSISDGPESGGQRPTVWGRTPGKKLAMESVDLPFEDEAEIERLEVTKIDLLDRIAEEASGNENLQASLERRKNASHERRLALEQELMPCMPRKRKNDKTGKQLLLLHHRGGDGELRLGIRRAAQV